MNYPTQNNTLKKKNTINNPQNQQTDNLVKLKRCPNGTRRNLKTGNCDKIQENEFVEPAIEQAIEPAIAPAIEQAIEPAIAPAISPAIAPAIEQAIEPAIEQPAIEQAIEPAIEQPAIEQAIEPAIEQAIDSISEPIQLPSPTIKKRCPNGTRRDKNGNCISKQNITRKSITPIKNPSIQELAPEQLPLPLPLPQEPVLEQPEINAEEDINLEDELTQIPSDSNEYLREKEKIEYQLNAKNTEYDFLYPELNDPNFNIKIAKKKEFNDTQYDGAIKNIKEQAELMCNADFELMPHQLFVKNFLSFQTPYNSLLLYHALGSGKTCSAIGVAEEMRSYMKQMGIKQRILIIASPNVQDNFRMQLFDEKKLKFENDLWNIQSCIGNTLIKEVNPTNMVGLTRDKVISNIKSIINTYYVFMGYVEFSNYISKKTSVSAESGYTDQEMLTMKKQNIKKIFSSRLIIIDEVHNIRNTDDNKNKRIANQLFELAQYADNLRFLFLSATPMYNSYTEIIWLVNLMNLNDGRSQIYINDVFKPNGEFKEPEQLKNGKMTEGGRELLKRKLIGYVSFIRGENPYTFPYRIYPNEFALEHTFATQEPAGIFASLFGGASPELNLEPEQVQLQEPIQTPEQEPTPEPTAIVPYTYPTIQLNTKPIEEPLKHIKVYVSQIGEYQESGYSYIINNMKSKSLNSPTGEDLMPTFENMETFGYTMLMAPLEALNIVYPNTHLDSFISMSQEDQEQHYKSQDTIYEMIGKQGLSNIMNSVDKSSKNPPERYNFDYKPEIISKYGRIFDQDNISKYSSKIANICNIIAKPSKGIILIYSQYIDGGVVPIALALEEMGFLRYGSASNTKSLFKKQASRVLLDAVTMTPITQVAKKDFKQARYMMITGDKSFSPNNAQDIKFATDKANKDGHEVKVILISKAGSEGLDFKNIRQVHVMEPWYNMNRIEQIIGRGVRNLSHCMLPFEQRNVEIYLHSTIMSPSKREEECADLYVYRLAERKAIQIGRVTRLLKENSVDCLLNISQSNFTVDKLNELAANQQIELELSSGITKQYKIGDRAYTDVCDYMDNCNYTCSPTATIGEGDIVKDTYNNEFVNMNNARIIERIRELFKDRHFYKREELFNSIKIVKQYPDEQIYSALTFFVKNKTELLVDKYGRLGRLIDKSHDNEVYYVFQPVEITDEKSSIYDRSVPVNYKRPNISIEIPDEFTEIQQPLPPILGKPNIPTKTQTRMSQSQSLVQNPNQDMENYLKFLGELNQYMNNIYDGVKNPTAHKDWNWYMHAKMIYKDIETIFGIPPKILKMYFIYHALDQLFFYQKMVFIRLLYTGSWEPVSKKEEEMYFYEEVIKTYFDKCIMTTEKGQVGALLNKDNSIQILVQSRDKKTWQDGQSTDTVLFSSELAKHIVRQDKMNNYVGFFSLFRNSEIVFYIKDLSKPRNSGARADSAGKVSIMNIINSIQQTKMYNVDNTKHISQQSLCIILEVLMRSMTDGAEGTKYWFLRPEEAAIIKI